VLELDEAQGLSDAAVDFVLGDMVFSETITYVVANA
jgi:hypothetical protein